MKQETIDAFTDAFCHELDDIKASLDNNGGHFSCDREIRNAVECVSAIKDLLRISSMETSLSAKSVVR